MSNSVSAPDIGNRVFDLTDRRLRSRKMDALLGMTDVVGGRAGSRRLLRKKKCKSLLHILPYKSVSFP